MIRAAPVQHTKSVGAKTLGIAQAANPFPDRKPAVLRKIARRLLAARISQRRLSEPFVPSLMEPLKGALVAILRVHHQQFVEHGIGFESRDGRGLGHRMRSLTKARNGSIDRSSFEQ